MAVGKENFPSRQDLVAQLLEERRQRLQLKLQDVQEPAGAFDLRELSDQIQKLGDQIQRPGGESGPWRAPLKEVQAAWLPKESAFTPVGHASPRGGALDAEGMQCAADASAEVDLSGIPPASDAPISEPSMLPLRWQPAVSSSATALRPQSAPQRCRPKERTDLGDLLLSRSRPEPGPEPAPQPKRGFQARQREWSQRQRVFQEKQQRARQEKEQREMQQCTFKPTISCKSAAYARRGRGCSVESLADRLYHEADKRTTLREKAKEIIEADEAGAHTFAPSINAPLLGKGAANRIPIHKRVDMIQKQKQERVNAAQLQEEKQLEGKFQPQISTRSRKIVQQKQSKLQRSWSDGQLGRDLREPVEDRLFHDAQLLEQRRAAQESSHSSASTPSVDEASRRICKSSVYFQGAEQDFLTRQKTFEAARQRRHEIRSQHAAAESSFTPNICVSSRQLVATKLDFLQCSPSDTTERLAVKDVGRRGQRQRCVAEAAREECTFRPAVSPGSEQILAATQAASSCSGPCSAHERLYRAALEGKSRSDSQTEDDSCSFRPQVSPESAKKFAHVRGHYFGSGADVMRNVQDELGRKSEALAERRRELEAKEMSECTFVPGAGTQFEDQCAPVPVSGLDRFFELRGLAQQKRERQRLREEQVLRPDLSNARCLGVTIPVPFGLSGQAPSASSSVHQHSM